MLVSYLSMPLWRNRRNIAFHIATYPEVHNYILIFCFPANSNFKEILKYHKEILAFEITL